MFYKQFTSENVRRILITPKTKFTSSPRSGGQIMGDFVFPEKRIIMFWLKTVKSIYEAPAHNTPCFLCPQFDIEVKISPR